MKDIYKEIKSIRNNLSDDELQIHEALNNIVCHIDSLNKKIEELESHNNRQAESIKNIWEQHEKDKQQIEDMKCCDNCIYFPGSITRCSQFKDGILKVATNCKDWQLKEREMKNCVKDFNIDYREEDGKIKVYIDGRFFEAFDGLLEAEDVTEDTLNEELRGDFDYHCDSCLEYFNRGDIEFRIEDNTFTAPYGSTFVMGGDVDVVPVCLNCGDDLGEC